MTPQEIQTALNEIAAKLSREAWVSISIRSKDKWSSNQSIDAVCYPEGVSGKAHRIDATGETFGEAVANLKTAIDENYNKIIAAAIRKLALAIITTTADLGECSDAALRGNGFAQYEIDMHGAAACAEATRMAAGGPFEIVRHVSIANAAE